MSNLRQSVHAGIGAAGAVNFRLFLTKGLDRFFQKFLCAGAVSLLLPAEQIGADILDDHSIPLGHNFCLGLFLRYGRRFGLVGVVFVSEQAEFVFHLPDNFQRFQSVFAGNARRCFAVNAAYKMAEFGGKRLIAGDKQLFDAAF